MRYFVGEAGSGKTLPEEKRFASSATLKRRGHMVNQPAVGAASTTVVAGPLLFGILTLVSLIGIVSPYGEIG